MHPVVRFLIVAFLIWLIPFLVSLPFFDRTGQLQANFWLFKGIMALVLSGSTVVLFRWLVRRWSPRPNPATMALLGLGAAVISVALDTVTVIPYHDAVKAALIADGWTITHDPYRIEFGGRDVFVDLGAEREPLDPVLAAERGTERIAVEIKTFTGPSVMVDLQQAIGQYALYQSWMRRTEPERLLFLAVDTEAARGVFE